MFQRDWAVREGDWKLLRGKLVNLTDENPERKDYSKAKPELRQRLQKLHDDWLKDVTPK